MDEVFFLDEEARGRFLGTLAQALGCTYLCLWSYYPFPSNQLFSIHGWFNDNTAAEQPSSSSHHQISGALAARTLFHAYRQTLQTIANGCVPGLAFKEGVRYLELKELELLNRASSDIQRKFYQEARIKTAVFMGCKSGEIEIGISNLNQQINIEMELKKWFLAEEYQFPQQHSNRVVVEQLPRGVLIDQSWNVSSSSSPLRSLSVGSSPEYSSLHLLNTPIPSSSPFVPEFPKESVPIIPNNSILLVPPQNQQLQAYNPSSFGNKSQFPNAENDDEAMTRAILAVISSASSSSCQSLDINRDYSYGLSHNLGAFKKYLPGLSPNIIRMKRNSQGQDTIKRSIAFYKNMDLRRKIEEQTAQLGARPTTSQLHHKMSERRRREKLNESFESLRSLLPSSSKKDKASLLSNTRDYLGSLKTEISELKQKCRLLEARLAVSAARRASLLETGGSSSDGNVEILITQQASEPTTAALEEQEIDLQVTVRGEYCNNMMDLVIRILEFLKQVENISLVNMEADTQSQPPSSFHRAIFRLKIKGNEFDNSTFQEAIKRIIADVAK